MDPRNDVANESEVGAMRRRQASIQNIVNMTSRLPDYRVREVELAITSAVGPQPTNEKMVGSMLAGTDLGNGATSAQESTGIGWAVKQMHNGAAVTRRGWNGKGMFLRLQYPDVHSKMTQPYVYMVTADQQRVPWLCSQSDLLAFDWQIFLTE